jgi:hypothetical protein
MAAKGNPPRVAPAGRPSREWPGMMVGRMASPPLMGRRQNLTARVANADSSRLYKSIEPAAVAPTAVAPAAAPLSVRDTAAPGLSGKNLTALDLIEWVLMSPLDPAAKLAAITRQCKSHRCAFREMDAAWVRKVCTELHELESISTMLAFVNMFDPPVTNLAIEACPAWADELMAQSRRPACTPECS